MIEFIFLFFCIITVFNFLFTFVMKSRSNGFIHFFYNPFKNLSNFSTELYFVAVMNYCIYSSLINKFIFHYFWFFNTGLVYYVHTHKLLSFLPFTWMWTWQLFIVHSLKMKIFAYFEFDFVVLINFSLSLLWRGLVCIYHLSKLKFSGFKNTVNSNRAVRV